MQPDPTHTGLRRVEASAEPLTLEASSSSQPATSLGGSGPAKTGQARHAWREIDRGEPPKRAAAERITDFHEIYSLFDEATIREQASRCVQCASPACVTGCPLGNHIPEWMSLAAEGRFLEAAEASRATSNMPEICPRVCPQERLCEAACVVHEPAGAICIGAIEKFINEYAFAHGYSRPFTYIMRAFGYEQLGDLAKATQLLQECLAAFPKSIVARAAYAELLRKQGQYEQAKQQRRWLEQVDARLARSWDLALRLKDAAAADEAKKAGLLSPGELEPRLAAVLVQARAYYYLK